MTNVNEEDALIKFLCNQALDLILNLSRQRIGTLTAIFDILNNFMPMPRTIKVSKEKEGYLNLATRFEAAVNKVLDGAYDESVADRYELDLETLRKEIHRFRNSESKIYDYTHDYTYEKIFSYKEELALLEVLTKIPHPLCLCRSCTLERLPFLAYYVARRRYKSYPTEWDKEHKAGKKWLTNFEIEYAYELANSFPLNCMRDVNKEHKNK